ncbi:hypothetical protein SAMN05216191_109122 [Paenibacillus jilunlii]|uniref:Uncharacterized protein n=1 Tax=Paenibacillus jilunlii TaxID=682956 RepID=A0A1G9QTM9_9BACL|nr:hypothetical protein AML91_14845 [Paenibacillus jilunlii]SDM14378.1 hypothetical protein SAMN05216191_109122 [Paenibacillus jilunlii]
MWLAFDIVGYRVLRDSMVPAKNPAPGAPDLMTGLEPVRDRGFYLQYVIDVQFPRVTVEPLNS